MEAAANTSRIVGWTSFGSAPALAGLVSTNGSFLNDEPLTGARPFAENDALRVGNTTLVLKVVS